MGSGHPLNPILSTQGHGPRIRNNQTLHLVTVGAARKRQLGQTTGFWTPLHLDTPIQLTTFLFWKCKQQQQYTIISTYISKTPQTHFEMPKYTETDLQNALSDIRNGLTTAQAARLWGVPRTTLINRKQRHCEPHRVAATHLQRLSHSQETLLAKWILDQGSLGFPLSHGFIRYLVQRVLAEMGDTELLGKHWMQRFFERNPAVKTLAGKRIEKDRLENADPTKVARQSLVPRLIPAMYCSYVHAMYLLLFAVKFQGQASLWLGKLNDAV